MLFRSTHTGGTYPEDVDIYTFLFERFPDNRPPLRNRSQAILIDDETGSGLTFEQVKETVDCLGVGMSKELGVTWNTTIATFSSNSFNYPIAVWAAHRQGAVVSTANPAFGLAELTYQLDAANAEILVTGYNNRELAYDAAEKKGIRRDRVVVLLDPVDSSKLGQPAKVDGAWTIDGLIASGRQQIFTSGLPTRKTLSAGEARKKLALLSFSSGTTGLPKGVAISHAGIVANVLQTVSFNDIGAEWKPEKGRFRPGKDINLGQTPLFHIYGLSTLLLQFWIGCATVIVPRFRGIEPMLQSCLRHKISIWWFVPPFVVLLCKDPAAVKYHSDVHKLVNFIMISAAPLSDDLSRLLEDVLPGVDWGQGFGMTEISTIALMHPPNMKPVFGSAGQLVTDTEAKVLRPDGSECGIDEPGELLLRGPQTALGYLNNEKATKEMFIEDGWLRTGDGVVFHRNAEKPETFDAFIVDRLKELIKVNANQVAPAELEGSILQLADVKDVGVIGVPDDMAGERPIAFVALSVDALQRIEQKGNEEVLRIKEGIKKHIRDTKISYKRLQRVEIIDAVPASPSGKILRRELRELAKNLAPLPSPTHL